MSRSLSPITEAWERTGRYVELLGQRIFVVERGSGPVLLLVHGFPTSSYDYRPLMDRLSARFRCIAFDFPGYGLSSKPAGYSYSLYQQADVAAALLRALSIERAHVICHDMGTSVVCELLARQDEGALGTAIDRVLFTNGSMLQWLAELSPLQKLLAANETLLQGMDVCARIADFMVPGLRGLTRKPNAITADDEVVIRELLVHDDGHLRLPAMSGYMRERYVHKERWIGALTQNAARSAIAWGTEDVIANLAMGRQLHALMPESPYTELDGVGHFVIFEDPDRVAAAFLAHVS
jgi:pimeloyl-ACP methyl ester carboxylesterase